MSKFSQQIYAWRGLPPILILLWLFTFPRLSLAVRPLWLLAALLLLLGISLRVWARRYIGEHSRSNTLAAPILLTTGPYSLSCNPLYLSNIAIGWGVIALRVDYGNLLWGWVIFASHYWLVARVEYEFLKQKYGQEYLQWIAQVPFFIGKFHYQAGQPHNSLMKAVKNDYLSWLWLTLVIILILGLG